MILSILSIAAFTSIACIPVCRRRKDEEEEKERKERKNRKEGEEGFGGSQRLSKACSYTAGSLRGLSETFSLLPVGSSIDSPAGERTVGEVRETCPNRLGDPISVVREGLTDAS